MEEWKRSSYCDGGHCVEILPDSDGDGVWIRNNFWAGNAGAAGVFATWAEWDAFILGAKNSEFDFPKP